MTQDEILRDEDTAVTPQDVRLTIQKIKGSQSVIDVFNDHRTSANFSRVVPRTSVLAERLEYKIRVDTYPNAKTLGYYALIKFNTPGVYNIKSAGDGVRGLYIQSRLSYRDSLEAYRLLFTT